MKRTLAIITVVILIGVAFSVCQGIPVSKNIPSQTEGIQAVTEEQNSEPETVPIETTKPEIVSLIPEDTGEVHHAISGAKRFVIPGKSEARIAEMRFIESSRLLLGVWEDGSFQQLVYYNIFTRG